MQSVNSLSNFLNTLTTYFHYEMFHGVVEYGGDMDM